MYKQWKLYDDVPNLTELQNELKISKMAAAILWHRNIRTVAAARKFLEPGSQPFYDPFLLADMDKAVARITTAIENEEKIVVYGDYDVDGMTATALLLHNLQKLGARASFYIPDRATEGYGFNLKALEKIAAGGAQLLISVDCGISSVDDVAKMAGKLDIVITDHHLPSEKLPMAIAVVNPHREDCPYPDKNLAGVGVAYKLSQALYQKLANKDYSEDLELVALGTVADVVPLLGENRRIVSEGLKLMKNSSFAGISELIKVAGLENETNFTAAHIGFRLAPRLNAAGRIGSPIKGVRLLLADNQADAQHLAAELDRLNTERQTIEQDILARAEAELANIDVSSLPAIIVAGENWNVGVIGIVASRLVDRYYKPTIVMSIQPNGDCKGSCRSIEGLHMFETLGECREFIKQYGGHAQAAGLTVELNKLREFKQAFCAAVSQKLTAKDYIPKVTIDFEILPEDLTFELVDELASLEPYGAANPKPLLGARSIRANSARAIGANGQHLQFQVGNPKNPLKALFWNMSEYAGIVNAETIDMAYSPAVNKWQGRRTLQCMVDSISPSDSEKVFPEREILANVYRYLMGIQKREGKIPYTASALALGYSEGYGHISLYTLSMALKIFQELNILRLNLKENSYYLPKVTGRMDLINSPTYRNNH